MRKSILEKNGNEIETGIKITPNDWGVPYFVIDESAACEQMVNCDFTDGDGRLLTADDFQNDLDQINETCSIYEFEGKFYAVDGDRYIEVSNPAECEDGLLHMIGSWEDFDEYETPVDRDDI